MITAVDTNILIDVFGADLKFGEMSAHALRESIQLGTLCACEIVWTEIATIFHNEEACLNAMQTLGIEFSNSNFKSIFLASKCWYQHRQNGGKRERVVADFLIGAHASIHADRLLTRDRGFYKTYYKSLVILDPSNCCPTVQSIS